MSVESRQSTAESATKEKESSVDEFPEGGARAWLAVLGIWLIQFSTFGQTNAYGVFNDYYVRSLETKYSSFQLSWIGSVQLMLVLSVGLLTGRAFDRGYFYHLMIFAAVLFIFCLFMLSLIQPDQYYQVFLVQAIGLGVAIGTAYIPAMALVSHYFRHRRAFAMGIATSGSGVGGAVQAIMLNKLIYRLGFAKGIRVNAAFNCGLAILSLIMMRTRLPPSPKQGGSLFNNLRVFLKDPPYVFTIIGTILVLSGLYFPIFFLQLNAVKNGIDQELAFYVITVLNGASVIGRIIPNIFVRRVGVFNVVVPCLAACAILIFCTLLVKTIADAMVFAVLYGLFSGAYIGLLAPMLASLAKTDSEIGARMGICFTFTGMGGLIGAPIAGQLLSTSFIWWRPIIFSGICVSCGTLSLTISRILLARRKKTQLI